MELLSEKSSPPLYHLLENVSSLSEFFCSHVNKQSLSSECWGSCIDFIAFNCSLKKLSLRQMVDDLKVVMYVYYWKEEQLAAEREKEKSSKFLAAVLENYLGGIIRVIKDKSFASCRESYSLVVDLYLVLNALKDFALTMDLNAVLIQLKLLSNALKDSFGKPDKQNCILYFDNMSFRNRKAEEIEKLKKVLEDKDKKVLELQKRIDELESLKKECMDRGEKEERALKEELAKGSTNKLPETPKEAVVYYYRIFQALSQYFNHRYVIINQQQCHNSNEQNWQNESTLSKMFNHCNRQHAKTARFFYKKYFTHPQLNISIVGSYALGLNQPHSSLDLVISPNFSDMKLTWSSIEDFLQKYNNNGVNFVLSHSDQDNKSLLHYVIKGIEIFDLKANVFIYKEKYDFCTNFLQLYFSKDSKMYQMHIFLSPLLTFFGGVDICFLILAFFGSCYSIFEDYRLILKYRKPHHRSRNSIEVKLGKKWYYSIRRDNYDNAMKQPIDKLIVNFLSFLIKIYRTSFGTKQHQLYGKYLDRDYLFSIATCIEIIKDNNVGEYWVRVANSVEMIEKQQFTAYDDLTAFFYFDNTPRNNQYGYSGKSKKRDEYEEEDDGNDWF